MKKSIDLVDRGRGLQLSTSRITVQDLVPYFQDNCSDAEIIRWIPTLTAEEIAVVRQYYLDHRAALPLGNAKDDEFCRPDRRDRSAPPYFCSLLRQPVACFSTSVWLVRQVHNSRKMSLLFGWYVKCVIPGRCHCCGASVQHHVGGGVSQG